jgi:hypothetical protein
MGGDTGKEIEALYRRCAALRQGFQEAALRSVPLPKLREWAEQLGLPVTSEMAQVSEGDLAFAFDLAVYSVAPGRSRAIDRVARQRRTAQDEAALVLDALTHSWFSLFRGLGPHPEAGLLLEDALLGGEVWVVDEALAEFGGPGTVLAMRLGRVRGFAMACGPVVPLDELVLAGFRQIMTGTPLQAVEMTADPRFARLIYERALGFQIGDGFIPR